MAFSGTLVAARPGRGRRRRDRRRDRDRPHQRHARRGRDADHAAASADGRLRPRLTIVILALGAAVFVFARLRRAAIRSSDAVHGRGRPGGRRDPRRPAGGHDDHARDRRPADGAAQRHHPPPAGGRDAGLGLGDLLRQDRHAHPERDDGRHGRPPTAIYRGHRDRLRAARRASGCGEAARSIPPPSPLLVELARAALLCNDASLRRDRTSGWIGRRRSDGGRAGRLRRQGRASTPSAAQGDCPRTRRDPLRCRSIASWRRLHHDHADGACISVKGAPERLLEHVRRRARPARRRGAARRATTGARTVDALAARGQRVLALRRRSRCRRRQRDARLRRCRSGRSRCSAWSA